MPYPSKIGTPNAKKNLRISGAIGAAPDIAVSALLNPNFFLRALKERSQPIFNKIFAIGSLKLRFNLRSAAIFPR